MFTNLFQFAKLYFKNTYMYNCVTGLYLVYSGAKCIVLNVEYRLCPENRVPAPFDDGQVVTEWALQNKTTVGECHACPDSNQTIFNADVL